MERPKAVRKVTPGKGPSRPISKPGQTTQIQKRKLAKLPVTPREGTSLLFPKDIVTFILPYLEPADLVAFGRTCHHYRAIVNSEDYWAGLARADGDVPWDAFKKASTRIPPLYVRYLVLCFEIGGVPLKGVEQYCPGADFAKKIGEKGKPNQVHELWSEYANAVCFGLYKGLRWLDFGDLGIELEKEDGSVGDHWGAALEGLICGEHFSELQIFLTRYPPGLNHPTGPLFTAMNKSDQVFHLLHQLYQPFIILNPLLCQELFLSAYQGGLFHRCQTFDQGLAGIPVKKFIPLIKNTDYFDFIVHRLSDNNGRIELLKQLLCTGCKNSEWLDDLVERIGFVPISECLQFAEDFRCPEFYRFLLRRKSITLSEIDVSTTICNSAFRANLVFLASNRHPAILPILNDCYKKFNSQELANLITPYLLNKTKTGLLKSKVDNIYKNYDNLSSAVDYIIDNYAAFD